MKRSIGTLSTLFRTGTSEVDGDNIVMSVSSDTPYQRYDWRNDEEYWEVLDHAPDGIDMSRMNTGTPLLFNHNRDVIIGRNVEAASDGKKMRVKSQISNAPDVASHKMKIQEGILRDTSVGYSLKDGGTQVGEKDGKPIYKFKWTPFEASLVSIPADFTVGNGRQLEEYLSRSKESAIEKKEISVETEKSIDSNANELQKRSSSNDTSSSNAMNLKRNFLEQDNGGNATTGTGGATTQTAIVDVVKERQDSSKLERERIGKIEDYADAFKVESMKAKVQELAKKAKREGITFEAFQQTVLDNWSEAQRIDNPNPNIGMSRKERRAFSFVKLIRELGMGGREGLTGVEKDACEYAAKHYQLNGNRAGVTVPEDMLECNLAEDHDMDNQDVSRAMDQIHRLGRQVRALSVGSAAAGGFTVGTELLAGSMIELLRNKSVVAGLGPTILSGLVGNIAIPKVTSGATTYWLAEGASVTESDQAFAQLSLVPHRLGCDTAYTKQLAFQSSISIEAFVRDDIAKQQAVELDRVAITGLGVNGEPLGIFNTPSVGTVTFSGAATYAKILQFESDIEGANANLGPMSFLTTPATKGKWKAITPVASSTFPIFLWMNDPGGNVINGVRAGQVNGYPAYATKNVPGDKVIFGVWSELILAMWAGINIVVDEFSLKKSEQVEVTIHQWHDVALRHPTAFDVSTDTGAT